MNKAKIIHFCDKAAEVSLCFVAFSFAISIATTNVFLGFLIFFWFIKRILTKNFYPAKNPLNILFILLFVASFLSMFNTIELSTSIGGIGRLFKCLMLFWAIIDTVNDKAKLKRVVWAICAGLLLVSVDGIFQYFTGKDFIRGNVSLGADFWKNTYGVDVRRLCASMRSNIFACYLVSAIPLVLSLVLYYFKGMKRLFFALLGIMAFFCMVNTFFRGAALTFVVVIILLSIIKKDIKLAAVLLIIAVCVPFFLPKPVLKWAAENPNPIDFFVEKTGRRLHWQTALNMIKAHPVIGVGLKTFLGNYASYKEPNDPFTGFNAHNSYLHLAAETGFFGLTVFIGMIVAAIIAWRRSYRKIRAPDFQAISLGLFGAFIAFLVVSIFDSFLQSSNMTVLFYFILGLLMAANKIPEDTAV